jgi:hypothetical protein
MIDKPGFVRLVATLLLGALVALAVIGFMRWTDMSPQPPVTGRYILAVCGLASLYGLGVLWRPQRQS